MGTMPMATDSTNRGSATLKVSLPRTMALKAASYLENAAAELEGSFWDPLQNRVTPRAMRLEVERVRKWVAQIRKAAEPTRFNSGLCGE